MIDEIELAALRAASSAEAMREAAARIAERDMQIATRERDGASEDSDTHHRWDLARVALRDVAAAIRALSPDPGSAPVEGWKPIETAPKDQRILLATPFGVAVGVWLDNHNTVAPWAVWNTDRGPFFPERIALWRPLPPPPAEPAR